MWSVECLAKPSVIVHIVFFFLKESEKAEKLRFLFGCSNEITYICAVLVTQRNRQSGAQTNNIKNNITDCNTNKDKRNLLTTKKPFIL